MRNQYFRECIKYNRKRPIEDVINPSTRTNFDFVKYLPFFMEVYNDGYMVHCLKKEKLLEEPERDSMPRTQFIYNTMKYTFHIRIPGSGDGFQFNALTFNCFNIETHMKLSDKKGKKGFIDYIHSYMGYNPRGLDPTSFTGLVSNYMYIFSAMQI